MEFLLNARSAGTFVSRLMMRGWKLRSEGVSQGVYALTKADGTELGRSVVVFEQWEARAPLVYTIS